MEISTHTLVFRLGMTFWMILLTIMVLSLCVWCGELEWYIADIYETVG